MDAGIDRSGQDGLAHLSQQLEQNFSRLHQLCATLENVADRLPHHVEASECLILAQDIYPTIKQAHEFEEAAIFPLLKDLAKSDPHILSVVARLLSEHMEDESFADVLREKLLRFANDREQSNIESLSWMLRGFFDTVRRHMAFERECLIPVFGSDWQHAS